MSILEAPNRKKLFSCLNPLSHAQYTNENKKKNSSHHLILDLSSSFHHHNRYLFLSSQVIFGNPLRGAGMVLPTTLPDMEAVFNQRNAIATSLALDVSYPFNVLRPRICHVVRVRAALTQPNRQRYVIY